MSEVTSVTGLKIGGIVKENESVGMHIEMPKKPGVGVHININDQIIDNKAKKIMESIPNIPETEKILEKAKEVLDEKESELKINKFAKFKEFCSTVKDVAVIAATIFR